MSETGEKAIEFLGKAIELKIEVEKLKAENKVLREQLDYFKSKEESNG